MKIWLIIAVKHTSKAAVKFKQMLFYIFICIRRHLRVYYELTKLAYIAGNIVSTRKIKFWWQNWQQSGEASVKENGESDSAKTLLPRLYFVCALQYSQLRRLSQSDQLPTTCSLIARLVEHCTGIAEVMGSNLNFFHALISQLLYCVHNYDDQSCLLYDLLVSNFVE